MVKVLLVDDESLIRNILKDYLSSDESLEVVGEASNGKLAISQAKGPTARCNFDGYADASDGRC